MEIEEDLEALNKRTLDEVEEMSIDTFATTIYRLVKKVCNQNSKDIPASQSTWNPVRFLVLK